MTESEEERRIREADEEEDEIDTSTTVAEKMENAAEAISDTLLGVMNVAGTAAKILGNKHVRAVGNAGLKYGAKVAYWGARWIAENIREPGIQGEVARAIAAQAGKKTMYEAVKNGSKYMVEKYLPWGLGKLVTKLPLFKILYHLIPFLRKAGRNGVIPQATAEAIKAVLPYAVSCALMATGHGLLALPAQAISSIVVDKLAELGGYGMIGGFDFSELKKPKPKYAVMHPWWDRLPKMKKEVVHGPKFLDKVLGDKNFIETGRYRYF